MAGTKAYDLTAAQRDLEENPAEPEAPPTRRHRAILPMRLDRMAFITAQREKTQALWPWYLVPFPYMDISIECRAMVEGTYKPADEDERLLLQTELAGANTVCGDAPSAIVQQPGAISVERAFYKREGFKIISPCEGEPNDPNQPLNIYPPQLEDSMEFGSIGIKNLQLELRRRQPWVLAQIDAHIADGLDRAREGDSTQRRYYRDRVAKLRAARRAQENGLPTVKELEHFFLVFERLRLQARQDARMRQEAALQQQVDVIYGREQAVLAEINAGVTGAEWAGEAVPA